MLTRVILAFLAVTALFAQSPPSGGRSRFSLMVRRDANVVAYWKMNESSTSFVDKIHGYVATPSGAGVTYAAAGGQVRDPDTAATFAAPADITVDAAGSAALAFERTTAFTIECVCKIGSTTGFNVVLSKKSDTTPFPGWAVYINSSTHYPGIIMDGATSGRIEVRGSAATLTPGFWYHIVWTYTGSNASSGVAMYVNGIALTPALTTSGTPSATITTAQVALIGSRPSLQQLTGSIDELAVYTTAKSAAWVLAHFQAAMGVDPTAGNAEPTSVILDTDIGSFWDDAAGLYHLLQLERQGHASIKAIGVGIKHDMSASTARVFTDYFSRSAIPIGAYQGSTTTSGDNYANSTAVHFLGVSPPGRATFTECGLVYRQALHDAADNSIVFSAMGGTLCLNSLLSSVADGIDSRSGVDLITAKVRYLALCEGVYPTGTGGDAGRNPTGLSTFFASWPSPIYVLDEAKFGTPTIAASIALDASTNPLGYVNSLGGTKGSWGPQTNLAAVFAISTWTSAAARNGSVAVNAGTGATTWSQLPVGKVTWVTLIPEQLLYRTAIDALVTVEPI